MRTIGFFAAAAIAVGAVGAIGLEACGGRSSDKADGAGRGDPVAASRAAGSPRVLWVAPSGNDDASGSQRRPKRSIAVAMKALAATGGTVVVADGEYPKLEFRQPAAARLVVVGAEPPRGRPRQGARPGARIAGAGLGGATNVTLEGLSFVGAVGVAGSGAGPSKGVVLDRVEISGGGDGACVRTREGVEGFTVRTSWIHDCFRGVSGYQPASAPRSTGIHIIGNLIERCVSDGIAFGGWDRTLIRGNTIRDLRDPAGKIHNDGIQLFGDAKGVVIDGNRVSGSNGQLILLQSSTGQAEDVTVTNNVLFGSTGFAVQASGMPKLRIVNNTIWNEGGYSAVLLRPPPEDRPEFDFSDAEVANNILSGLALYDVRLPASRVRGNFTPRSDRAIEGPGNVVGGDPGFVDVRRGDFRLRRGSAARGAADADLAPSVDIDGRRRGASTSIGAYR